MNIVLETEDYLQIGDCLQIGDYLISNMVFQCYPPIHKVKFPNGAIKDMDGGEIYQMLQLENITGTRFDEYTEHVKFEISDDNNYYPIGDMLISKETISEKMSKYVIKFPNNVFKLMSGVEVYNLLKSDALSHPAFNVFSNDITKSKYIISDMCKESYPCKHYVTFPDGNKILMSGVKIYEMLAKENLEIPTHFKEYKDFKFLR